MLFNMQRRDARLTECTPAADCLKVVESEMGGITAPLEGSGSWPAWMARVPKPGNEVDEGVIVGGGEVKEERNQIMRAR